MSLLEMAVLACSLIIFQLYGQQSFNGAWDGWLGTGAQRRYVMCHTPECALSVWAHGLGGLGLFWKLVCPVSI